MVKRFETEKMPQEAHCILRYFAHGGSKQYTEVLAALRLFFTTEIDEKAKKERLSRVSLMCRNMKPDAEDVTAVLFAYLL